MTDKKKSEDKETLPVVEVTPKLSDADKAALNQVILNRKISLLQAEKVLAQHELAEMQYKYSVMQLYMKYGLTEKDTITESGDIVKGGAAMEQSK